MNKDLFLRVYNYKVINRIINSQIRYIHANSLDKNTKIFKWIELTPVVLSQYGYFEQFKLQTSNVDRDDGDETMPDCGCQAARFGHIHILKFIFENYNLSPNSKKNIFSSALRSGNLPIIEYVYSILESGSYNYPQFYGDIAHSGQVKVCEWFTKHFKYSDGSKYFFYSAISYGNVDVLKWGVQFFKNEKDKNGNLWMDAIKRENVELLDFMYDHERFSKSFNVKKLMCESIKRCDIKVIDWMYSKYEGTQLYHTEVFQSFIERGIFKLIEYCSDRLGFKVGDHRNEAEWFFKKCEECGFNAIDYAIESRTIEIIIWFYKNTDFIGTLNPLEECYYSLDLLKWFTENNRPETIPTDTLAKFFKFESYVPNVEYIVSHRTEQFPYLICIIEYLLFNSESNELVEKFLLNKEIYITSNTMKLAISKNRIAAVKWIHGNTTVECTEEAIRNAYYLKDSTIVEWLHQNRTETCDPEYIKNNFYGISTPVLYFIFQNKPEMVPPNALRQICDFSLFKFIIDNYPTQYINDDSLIDVCTSGCVENVKYLHEYYKKHNIYSEYRYFNINSLKISLSFAIKTMFIDIVKYLCENGPNVEESNDMDCYERPMSVACKYGRIEAIMYLQEHTPYKLKSDDVDVVATKGNLAGLQCIYKKYGIKCSSKGLVSAAINGYFKVVRYLVDNNHELTSDMLEKAIKNSYLELVKIYLEYQFKYDFNIVDIASSYGSLEILKYLVENGFKGTTDAIDSASEHGYMEIIKFLKTNHHTCTTKAIDKAIDNSHISVAKWLLSNFEFPLFDPEKLNLIQNKKKRK